MLAIWVILQSTDIHLKLTFDIFFCGKDLRYGGLYFSFLSGFYYFILKTYIFYYDNAGSPYSSTPQLRNTHTTLTTRGGHIHETSTLFSNMVSTKRSRRTDSKLRYSGLKHGVRCTNNTDSLSAYFGVMAVWDFSSKVLQKLLILGKFLTSWVSTLRILKLVFISTSLYLLNHFFLPWIVMNSFVDSFGYKIKVCNQVPYHTLWSADAKRCCLWHPVIMNVH